MPPRRSLRPLFHNVLVAFQERRGWLLATVLVLLLGACMAPYEGDEDSSRAVAVELVIHGDAVDAISFAGADLPARAVPVRGEPLRWEVQDLAGTVVASGEIEDPRRVRAEFDTSVAEDLVGEVGRTRVIVPAVGGTLSLFEAVDDGWRQLGSVVLPVPGEDGALEQNLIRGSEDLVGAPTLVHAASTDQALRLLVVGDGYREADLEDFRQDVVELSAALLSIEGFADHTDEIEIYRQDVISDELGLADPRTGFDPVTAFELSYGDDVTRPRRCMMYAPSVGVAAMATLRERTLGVQADAVVILANTEDYGGCASPSDRVVTVSRHPSSAQILAHELGHTVFQLSDEYEYGACGAYADGPNVAAHAHELPWADLVNTSQLPTSTQAPLGTVGAFEGANHCRQGRYRATHHCRMRELGDAFCPVCRGEIDRFFERRAAGLRGAMTITNLTGVGLFVRCPHQPGPSCTDWTYLQPGEAKGIQTTGDGYAFIADAALADGSTIRWRTLVPGRAAASVHANAADPLSPR